MVNIRNKAAVIGFSYFCAVAALFFFFDGVFHKDVYALAGTTALIRGEIVEKTYSSHDSASYVVKAKIDGVSVKINMFAPDVSASKGDIIEFEAELRLLEDNYLFPEKTYNYAKNVLLGGEIKSKITIIEKSPKNLIKNLIDYIGEFNLKIKNEILRAFPNENGALLCAVFMGDKAFLTSEQISDTRIAGASHYTAVSGLHVTLITHMLMLIYALTPLKNNRKLKFCAAFLIIAFLALFFDLTKSVTRSAIMLIIVYGGELFMRRGNVLNSLGFALLLILIFEPYACFDAGLIMSFSGTFGVGVLAPALIKSAKGAKDVKLKESENEVKNKKLNPIIEALISSLCAALCVLPASALYFKGTSLLSPITSVVILPFFTIAAGSLVLFAVFSPFGIGGLFMLTAGLSAKIMNAVISLFGGINQAWFSLDYSFVIYWLILALISVTATYLIYKSAPAAAKTAVFTACMLALMICVYGAATNDNIYVEIYSDSSAGWVALRRGGNETIITTSDTKKSREAISKRKGEPLIIDLKDLEALNPEKAFYDISGDYILEIREENIALLYIDSYKILFTRASADKAVEIKADLTVAYGAVRNKREFNSQYIVYVSKSIPIENENEFGAYYEPVKLVIKES